MIARIVLFYYKNISLYLLISHLCFNSMQLKILSRHETHNQVLSSKADDIDFYYVRCIISEFILYIRIYLNR